VKLEFSRQIFETQISNFTKILPFGSPVVPYEQTDRHDEGILRKSPNNEARWAGKLHV